MVDAEPRERVDARDPEDGAEVSLDVAELFAERPAVDDGCDQREGSDEDANRQVGDSQRRQEVGIDARQHLRPEEDEQDEHVADDDRQHQQQDDARLYGERHCPRAYVYVYEILAISRETRKWHTPHTDAVTLVSGSRCRSLYT